MRSESSKSGSAGCVVREQLLSANLLARGWFWRHSSIWRVADRISDG